MRCLASPPIIGLIWSLLGASLPPTSSVESFQRLTVLHQKALDANRLDEAEAVARKMLRLTDASDRLGRRAKAISVIALADVLKRRGDYRQAGKLYRQAIDLLEQINVSERFLLLPLRNLVMVELRDGKLTECRSTIQRGLSIAERVLGPNHLMTAGFLNLLGMVEYNASRYSEGIAALERCLDILESQRPLDEKELAKVLNMLGACYSSQEQYEDAERVLKRNVAISRRQYGADDFETAIALNTLGCHYHNAGAYEDAETTLKESLNIAIQRYGEKHPESITMLMNLAGLYVDWNRDDKAEEMLVRIRQVVRRHPDARKDGMLMTAEEIRSQHLRLERERTSANGQVPPGKVPQ